MADEAVINEDQNQITYNVVLDPSDVARQAEEIRNQLDLALGVGSNAGAQFINTTDVINPQFAQTIQPDFSGMQGQFGSTTDQGFWQKAQDQTERITEAMSTGFDKIRQDVSMLLDRTTNVVQGFQPQPESANPYENLLPDTFSEKLLGSLGFGGDITGPIPLSTYERYSEKALSEDVKDIIQNPGTAWNDLNSAIFGDSMLGTVASMGAYAIPYVGPAMFAADIASMGDEWLSGAYNKREDLAGGIQEIARQQYGNISMEEARTVAQPMLDFVNSYEGYAKDYNIEEVSQNVLQFGNEGGFSKVRNTEQLSEWIKTITEDTRQFARDLGVFQEEAISIMAELAQKSGVSAESVREMGTQMRFYGSVLQQSPVELLGGAMQTAEQFRQAGLVTTPQTAMQTYLDASVEAQRLVLSNDPFVQSSVYRMGGQQGVVQGLLGAYAGFGSTSLGDLSLRNINTGAAPTTNVNDMLNNLSNNWGGFEGEVMWNARGKEEALKNLSFEEIALMYVGTTADIFSKFDTTPDTLPTSEEIEGFMTMIPEWGLSKDQARLMTQSVKNILLGGERGKEKFKNAEIYTKIQSAREDSETTFLGELEAKIIRPIDEFGREISYAYGEFKEPIAEDVADFVGNIIRLDDSGKLFESQGFYEGNYTTLDKLKPKYSTDQQLYDISLDTPEPDLSPTIIANFNDPYVKQQVALGRESEVGKLIDSMAIEDVKEKQIELLQGLKGGTTATDVDFEHKDLETTENKELLRKKGGDIENLLQKEDYGVWKDVQDEQVLFLQTFKKDQTITAKDLETPENQELLFKFGWDTKTVLYQENKDMLEDLQNQQVEILQGLKGGGKTITAKDLETPENKELLLQHGWDTETLLKKDNDRMWGKDSSFTKDQEFAINMWRKTPVKAYEMEEYYVDSIADELKDPETSKKYKDSAGEWLPLEDIMNKLDTEIPIMEGKEQVSEDVRKQIEFQAMSKVSGDKKIDEKLEKKVLTKEEADEQGLGTWDKLELGSIERKAKMTEARKILQQGVSEETKEFKKLIEKDAQGIYSVSPTGQPIAEVTPDAAFGKALSTAWDMVTAGYATGTPEERENKFMEFAEQEYNKTVQAGGKKWDEMGYEARAQSLAFSPGTQGAKSFERGIKFAADLKTVDPLEAAYDIVDLQLTKLKEGAKIDHGKDSQEYKEVEGLGLVSKDIAYAFADIIPGQLAQGIPLKIEDFGTEELKKIAEAVKLTQFGDSTGAMKLFTEVSQKVNFDLKETKANVEKIAAPIAEDLDTKAVGTNTKMMKTYLWDIRNSLAMMTHQKFKVYNSSTKQWEERDPVY